MANWVIKIAPKARKVLEWLPNKDHRLISEAFDNMTADPFSGDIVRLHSERSEWRRRVGNYRIFFDVETSVHIVDVVEIDRRTSNTY